MHASTNSSGDSRRGYGFWFWARLLLVCIPLAILLIITSAIAIRASKAQGRLKTQIAKWKANGIPYDNASLEEFYQRHTTEENLEPWKAALAVVQSPTFCDSTANIGPWGWDELGRVPVASQAWPQEAETRAFLERWKAFRDSLRELAKRDQAIRFPLRFDAMNTQVLSITDRRQLGRILVLETQVAIRDRDSAATREGLVGLLGVARSMEGQPFLLEQLVVIALENLALLELRAALEEDVLITKDLQAVRNRIRRRTPWSQSWRLSVQSERAGMLPIFTEPNRYSPKSVGVSVGLVPFRSRDTMAMIEWMNKAEVLSTKDLTTFYSEISSWGVELKQTANRGILSRMEMRLTTSIVPAMDAAGHAFIRRELLYRLAELSIDVRLYERQHGRLPSSLRELEENGTNLQATQPSGEKLIGSKFLQDCVVLWGFDSTKGILPVLPPYDDQLPRSEVWRFDLPSKSEHP